MSNELGPSVTMVSLVGVMETVAVVKTFSSFGYKIDANQEILAQGIANIFGSFASAMPTSGAFSRAAISCATKSRTMMNGLFTGAFVLTTIVCLTPCFYYVPTSDFFILGFSTFIGNFYTDHILASLASMTICAVLVLVKFEDLKKIWWAKRSDLIPFTVTFCSGLFFGIHYGLLIGASFESLKLLHSTIRPQVAIEISHVNLNQNYVIFKYESKVTHSFF